MIKLLDPQNLHKWDEFIQKDPDGSVFHHSAWINVLTATYNYKPVLVVSENSESGKIAGVMPFTYVDSPITGSRLVSLPFTSYCELLMSDSEISASLDFVQQSYKNIRYIELKLPGNLDFRLDHYAQSKMFCTHILDLRAELDDIFMSLHATSVRQRIRRAARNKLQFRIAEDEQELKNFYDLETGVRRKKGLPPPPYRFYYNIWKYLKPLGFFFLPVVEYENKIIAAAIVLKFKNKFYLEYSASDGNYLKYSPNQLLIWKTIAMAHEQGAESFDFGRSSLSNTSLIEFKERWAAKRIPLAYYYYPKLIGNTEEGIVRKTVEIFNKHLPDFLLRLEGNLLYPHLG